MNNVNTLNLSVAEAHELLMWTLFELKGRPNPTQLKICKDIYAFLKGQNFPIDREDEIKKQLKLKKQ